MKFPLVRRFLTVFYCCIIVNNVFSQVTSLRRFVSPKSIRLNTSSKTTDTIIIKFTEGASIELTRSLFRADPKKQEWGLLNRFDLNISSLKKELTRFNLAIQGLGKVLLNPFFKNLSGNYVSDHKLLEKKAGKELGKLNTYFVLTIKYSSESKKKLLLRLLQNLRVIETAYPIYHSENAVIKYSDLVTVKSKTTVTPDFSQRQQYLGPPPSGIDANYGWTRSGGRGENIRIVDIEQNWHLSHEDLKPAIFHTPNLPKNTSDEFNHGTAVLGILVAQHNRFGVKGISPAANFIVIRVDTQRPVSQAIYEAIGFLAAGDIILIEQHTPGPSAGTISVCNKPQFEYVPMEYYQDCFDAISIATASGIVVIEAAGNGQMDLDNPLYEQRFDRQVRNSGALMVGADEDGNGSPACFTNYGTRLDFFGWGEGVITTGYGDLQHGDINHDYDYTESFAGTSSASPMVAGVVAVIQGIRKNLQLPVWDAVNLKRAILGTSQRTSITKFIGIRPDLKATIQNMPNLCQ
jgi:serine protease